jgi:uncharacterized protein (TIGR03000 family)
VNYPTVADVPSAAIVRGLPGETRFRPNHPPGWDWWRIYPYVYRPPYYSPYYYPPYPYPYPVYSPYTPYMPGTPVAPAPAAAAPDVAAALARMPTVSGPLAIAPPGTAIIRIVVPDPRAQVLFDGVDTVTSGTLRTFVTPQFQNVSPQTFQVTARWVQHGKPVSEQREVSIQLGQVQTVTFTQPVGW